MNPCFKQKRTTVAPVAPENRSPRKKAEGQIPPSLKHEVEKYKIDVVENVASAKAPASVTTKDTVRKLTDQFEQDRLAGAKFAERHLDINKVIKENFAIMPEDSRAWSISSGWG